MKKSVLGKYKISSITADSRQVISGSLFIAVEGLNFDGHDFVRDAARNGASACIVSDRVWRTGPDKIQNTDIIRVRDTRLEMSRLAYQYFNMPDTRLKVTGITGTNGKTTVSLILDRILRLSGIKTGVIGTIYYRIGNKKVPASHTTPESIDLQKMMDAVARGGGGHAILEVSSHALMQSRTAHIKYDAAIFTNITPEHLDYHGSMEKYLSAKAQIFKNMKPAASAILNADDRRVASLSTRIRARKIIYGLSRSTDITAEHIRSEMSGAEFILRTPSYDIPIRTSMIGGHNISNILAAAAAAYHYGIDRKFIAAAVNGFSGAPGRLQRINMGQGFNVFIDYAHTEDALKNVLIALKRFRKKRIITVFGCGGDRDMKKRPKMGAVSGRLSDVSIITSDNPRSEDPSEIARQIESGLRKTSGRYRIMLNRKDAIKAALNMAETEDIVLIAGKGHETEQIVGNRAYRFDDRRVVSELLKK